MGLTQDDHGGGVSGVGAGRGPSLSGTSSRYWAALQDAIVVAVILILVVECLVAFFLDQAHIGPCFIRRKRVVIRFCLNKYKMLARGQ
jgi:hypothetical protein